MTNAAKTLKEHHRWFYPARDFDARTGIRGLRGGWVLPQWLDVTPRRADIALYSAKANGRRNFRGLVEARVGYRPKRAVGDKGGRRVELVDAGPPSGITCGASRRGEIETPPRLRCAQRCDPCSLMRYRTNA
jgi:hypothetical protein